MSARLVLRQIGVGVAVRGWTQVTSLVVMLFAGRALDREAFGVYAIASVLIIVLSTLIYSGLYEYVIKSSAADDAADTCFWLNLGLAFAGALVMLAVAPVIARVSHDSRVATIIVWLAPTAVISAMNSWQEALLLRADRMSENYAIWFLSETAAAALAAGLLVAGLGVASLIGYRYAQALLMLLCYLLHGAQLPRLRWNGPEARRAMQFAVRLYGSRTVSILSNYGADLIIGMLVGPAASGLYRIASRTVFGVSEVCYQPMRTLSWVKFTGALRAHGTIGGEWLGMLQLLSLVVWPALGGMAIAATPLVGTLLGSKWLAAAPVVTVLAAARAAGVFEIFLDPLMGTTNRPHQLLRIRALGAALGLGSLLLLGRSGSMGAAWAQVLTLGTIAAITIVAGLRITGVRPAELVRALAPGIVTTALTMVVARTTLEWAAAREPAVSVQFGYCVAAAALVWLLLVGTIFRRAALAALGRVHGAQAALTATP